MDNGMLLRLALSGSEKALRAKSIFRNVARICLMLAAASVNVFAQKPDPLSAANLSAITERGILLNEYDQAAWHASDAVQAANPKTIEGQRYIAKKENGRWTVVFGKLSAEKN